MGRGLDTSRPISRRQACKQSIERFGTTHHKPSFLSQASGLDTSQPNFPWQGQVSEPTGSGSRHITSRFFVGKHIKHGGSTHHKPVVIGGKQSSDQSSESGFDASQRVIPWHASICGFVASQRPFPWHASRRVLHATAEFSLPSDQASRQAGRPPATAKEPCAIFLCGLDLDRACGAVLHGRVTAQLVVSLQFGMKALLSEGGAAFRGGGPVVACARWDQSLGR